MVRIGLVLPILRLISFHLLSGLLFHLLFLLALNMLLMYHLQSRHFLEICIMSRWRQHTQVAEQPVLYLLKDNLVITLFFTHKIKLFFLYGEALEWQLQQIISRKIKPVLRNKSVRERVC